MFIDRQVRERIGVMENRMETMVLELNKVHLTDLKKCFDETANLKNVLNAVLEKMDQISESTIRNNNKIESLELIIPEIKQNAAKMHQNIEHIDTELQEYHNPNPNNLKAKYPK